METDTSRLIEIKVYPNASVNLAVIDGTRIVVKITISPEKGKANNQILYLIKKQLGLRLSIIRGHTTRTKWARILSD